MKLNTKPNPVRTHEGGTAKRINAEQQLRRSVMACLLWESQFYEDGVDIAERIAQLVPQVEPERVAEIAVEAREQMKLRHAPLLIVSQMDRIRSHKPLVAQTLSRVIQRADELTEYAAIATTLGGRKAVSGSAQAKRGLAQAFRKFDEYALAKYDRKGQFRLRDVLFLSHAKPDTDAQADLWRRLVDGELGVPDTWETALSGGEDKRRAWERLIREQKLGGLALLRNLRNMQQAGVSRDLIREAIGRMATGRILPFRFIAAARYAPEFEPDLEEAMFRSIGEDRLDGRTIVLVDVSGSMSAALSMRSDMRRLDAACGVAMIAREMCPDVAVYTFANQLSQVPARHGFALRDAIQSQPSGGTWLGDAVDRLSRAERADRLIVITDEQVHDRVPDPFTERAYMINVASYRNGVGYGPWTHIDGWSEAVLRYITELEASGLTD